MRLDKTKYGDDIIDLHKQDLRSPLSSIRSAIYLLQQQANDEQEISQEAAQLIEQLALEIEKIEKIVFV